MPDHPTANTPPLQRVLSEIEDERRRQDEKWGEQNHPPGTGEAWDGIGRLFVASGRGIEAAARRILGQSPTYTGVLMEEVGEALQETDPAKLRVELIQVAAVAAAFVECLDRAAIRKEGRRA